MERPPRADDRRHVGPGGGERATVVPHRPEGDVGGVAGEVEVIPGMVVAGGLPRIGDAMDEREVMPMLRRQGEVLADRKPRRRRGDRAEFPAVFRRRRGLHVPQVDMGRAAAEEEEDRRLRLAGSTGKRRGHLRRGPAGQPRQPRRAHAEHRTAAEPRPRGRSPGKKPPCHGPIPMSAHHPSLVAPLPREPARVSVKNTSRREGEARPLTPASPRPP